MQTTGDGIEIIDTQFSTSDAFSLASPVEAGAYTYRLFMGGVNQPNFNWYLRSMGFRSSTRFFPVIQAPLQEYGAAVIGRLHQRIGAQDLMERSGSSANKYIDGAWVRVIGENGHLRPNQMTSNYSLNAVQVGWDLYRGIYLSGARNHVGLYGVFGKIYNKLKESIDSSGHMQSDARTVGIYWTHYGALEQYLDMIVQGTHYDSEMTTIKNDRLTPSTVSYAASFEGGFPLLSSERFLLEPQAQLIYQTFNLGTVKDRVSIISFHPAHSLRGRIGLRLAHQEFFWNSHEGEQKIVLAITGDLWREFLTNYKTTFYSLKRKHPVTFSNDMSGNWAQLSLEGNLPLGSYCDLYVTGYYAHGFGSSVKGRTFGGTLGLKVNL